MSQAPLPEVAGRQPGSETRIVQEAEGLKAGEGRKDGGRAPFFFFLARSSTGRVAHKLFLLVATIEPNAGSFLKDLNFADELPYTGCLATKLKLG